MLRAIYSSTTWRRLASWAGVSTGLRPRPPRSHGSARPDRKAAQLNPANLDAQSDLFEYYLEAPGFLGGGFDRAAATAAQIARISPSEGYWAQARLAEKRKEFGSAEAQLRRALEIAPQQVGRLIDLARLLT